MARRSMSLELRADLRYGPKKKASLRRRRKERRMGKMVKGRREEGQIRGTLQERRAKAVTATVVVTAAAAERSLVARLAKAGLGAGAVVVGDLPLLTREVA